MRKILATIFLFALLSPALAQNATGPVGPGFRPTACAAFGTTTGTCIQGAGAGGTPSSINLTNGTVLPLSTGVTGTLPVANGGTGVTSIPSWSLYLGTNQTGVASATPTVVGFDTKLFDPNTLCDVVSNKGRCTPNVAGSYRISAGIYTTGTLTAGANDSCSISKNGTIIKEMTINTAVTTDAALICSALVSVNGSTDYLEIKISVTTSASTVTVLGSQQDTWFDGLWLVL